MKRLVVALLLLALASPAAAESLGRLEAERITTTQNTVLEGTLAAFESDDRAEGPGPSVGAFTLRAEEASLRMDWEEVDARAAGIEATPRKDGSTPRSFAATTMESAHARGDSYLFLAPLPGSPAPAVTYEATKLDMEPTMAAAETHRPFIGPSGPISAATTRSLRIAGDYPATLTVEGSFVVSLWDWDFTVGTQESEAFWTGERAEERVGAPIVRGVEALRKQQAYLLVENGVLTLELSEGAAWALHVHAQEATSPGNVRFAGAYGSLRTPTGVQEVFSQDVEVKGPLAFRLGAPTAARVPVLLEEAEAAAVDGRTLRLGGDEPTPWQRPWNWLPLLALLAAVDLVGQRVFRIAYPEGTPAGHRRRACLGYAALAERCHAAGNDAAALLLVSFCRVLDPRAPEPVYLRAVILTKARRPRVLRDHKRLDRLIGDQRERAQNAIQAAATTCTLNDKAAALRWLERARRHDLETLLSGLERREFAILRGQPRYDELCELRRRARLDVETPYS